MIKQINYDQFTKIVGTNEFHKFVEQLHEECCVLFITDWSVPSRMAVKRIKKFYFDKTKLGVIDVDLVDSIDLCQRFGVRSVPFFLRFKDKEKVQQFSGYRIEAMNDLFGPLIRQYSIIMGKKEKNIVSLCENKHQLKLTSDLDSQIYSQGYFYCNNCHRIDRCSKDNKVAHCDLCDYDLCFECFNKY